MTIQKLRIAMVGGVSAGVMLILIAGALTAFFRYGLSPFFWDWGSQNDSAVAQEQTACSLSSQLPENILRWCEPLQQFAGQNSLPADLVAVVMLVESAGDPDAYSRSGAVGLMQVMPRDGLASAFFCKNGPCFSDRPPTRELFDPEFNLSYGCALLSEYYQKYGDLREALKSYGPMDVGYSYADQIINLWNQYRAQ